MALRNLVPPSGGVLDPDVEKHRGRYYGEYAGFVRDVNDPQKRGRVRVWVPAIMGNEDRPRSWIDWCLPSSQALNVPPVGSPVWITFEMGMVEHGVYRWGWFPGETAATSAAPVSANWHAAAPARTKGFGPEIRANLPADPAAKKAPVYPKNRLVISEAGHTLELDDSPEETVDGVKTGLRARYRHPTGTVILVDADGSVHVRAAGATYFRSVGDYVVQLGQGASFKVVYPNGSGFVVGASGVHVTGDQATLLGRAIIPGGDDI